MALIWRAEEPLDAAVILKKANATYQKDWKPQTVSTFLTRLRHKGYLEMYRKGKSVFYKPLISVEEYRKIQVNTLLSRFYNGKEQDLIDELITMHEEHIA